MYLPDVNVWLALAFDSHQHHEPSVAWFRTARDETCFFCRLTQSGFLRLSSNPSVLGSAAVSLADAWRGYDALFADPRVAFVEEPEDIEPQWRSLTQSSLFSPKVWTDAYLAAFARCAGLEVVSFDQGFAQYTGIRITILP
jgi:toxin-antitoxin system PIN domain toxin